MINKIKKFIRNNSSTKQIIFKNTLWLWIWDAFSKGWFFLANILVANYLWTEWYGLFSYWLWFISFFVFVADFGLASRMTYFVAKYNYISKKLAQKIYRLKFSLAIATFAIVIITWLIITNATLEIWVLLIFTLFLICKSFNDLHYWYFRWQQNMQYEIICKSIWTIGLLIALYLVILFNWSILLIIGCYIVQQTLSLLVWFKIISYDKNEKLDLPQENICNLKILKNTFPYAIMILWWLVYFSIDIVMVKRLISNEAAWLYSAAVNIYQIYYFPATLITIVLLPLLTKNSNKTSKILRKSIIIFWLFWLLCLLLNLVLSKFIIKITYWELFYESINYLIILWYIIPFRYISFYIWTDITAQWSQYKRWKTIVICAIVNIFLNLLLIPAYWIYWAIYSTIATELLLFTSYIYIRFIHLKKKNDI